MAIVLIVFAALSLLFSGAIFGFFYAWLCSTMWGLDNTDPAVAIAAMQSVNASVRNMLFGPVFFGTPIVLVATAGFAMACGRMQVALAMTLAAVVYLAGGFAVTVTTNVPLNISLAEVRLPLEPETAKEIWQAYSESWQFYNSLRTAACGVVLLATGYGVFHLRISDAQ